MQELKITKGSQPLKNYCNTTTIFQVSWIRHPDIHLLSVGRYTYTSDQRFSVHHVPKTNLWQLRIRELNHEDAGKYECQVSTTPVMGHQMYLKVVGENIVFNVLEFLLNFVITTYFILFLCLSFLISKKKKIDIFIYIIFQNYVQSPVPKFDSLFVEQTR